MGKTKGFTLVELLVAISVIALLMAMLVPLLQASREKARRVACASGLRQFGFGLIVYASNYDDRIPKSLFDPEKIASLPAYSYQVYWVNLDATSESEKIVGGPFNLGHLFHERIIKDPKIFYCPSAGKGMRYEDYVGKFKWPFPKDSTSPNSSERIRVGYNYYPQGTSREKLDNSYYAYKSVNTLTSINGRSTISMDRLGSWRSGMHRQMGKSSGINILYGDGRVDFRVNKDTEEALWYPNPYNDADNFRALLFTLSD
ncbi:MAG: type II secretion system protein [Sedimentisphaerales bacterium]|nr:type II secretion system protein [Sedimentisphaerales bacterium]